MSGILLALACGAGPGPASVNANWGHVESASPATSATRTITFSGGGTRSLNFNITIQTSDSLEYQKNGGAWTTVTDGLDVSFSSGDTLAFRCTGDVGEGGAVLTHSGGAFGMLFGAGTEIAIEGSSDVTPTRGMGIGTGLGVLVAGATATQVDISSSRMLAIDLSVSLGGLSGAALASPLLFVEEPDETHTRLWVGAAALGAVAGAGIMSGDGGV